MHNPFQLKKLRKGIIPLALWVGGSSVLFGAILGQHMVPFQVNAEQAPENLGKEFTVSHFLNPDCGCSSKVMEHLIERGSIQDLEETIYFIGREDQTADRLRARGFKILVVPEDLALADFQVEAVPLLRIASRDRVIYAGAYGKDQKHSRKYDDLAIIEAARHGEGREGLPMFGCINGKVRKSKIDFLGLKYGKND